MYIRIKRRRFGSLALGSAATVALSNLPKRVLAQNKQLLYGIDVNDKGGSLTLYAFDIATGQVQNLGPQALSLNSQERLTTFSISNDRTFTYGVGNRVSVAGRRPAARGRLTSSSTQQLPPLSGISSNSVVESLLIQKNGQQLAILSLNQGSPPFRLANIDRLTGKVSIVTDVDFAANRRFSNLIECQDGSIYATTMGSEGSPGLVKIDRLNKSIVSGKSRLIYLPPLTFNKKPLENDLLGLACSASNRIFALADPAYEGTNSLFAVDLKTGTLKFVAKFPVSKIAFSK